MKEINSDKFIVSQCPSSNPVFLKLSKYVRDRKLTPALLLLEKKGIDDDLARFVISVIQSLQEAV